MLPEKRSGRYQAYHIRPPDSTLIWGRLKHALLDCQHGAEEEIFRLCEDGILQSSTYNQYCMNHVPNARQGMTR